MRYIAMILALPCIMLLGCNGQKTNQTQTQAGSTVSPSPEADGQQDVEYKSASDLSPTPDAKLKYTNQPDTKPTAKPKPAAGSTTHYTVRAGDTYWNIAAGKLGDGHRWKEIEKLNPTVDHTDLHAGQIIVIPAK